MHHSLPGRQSLTVKVIIGGISRTMIRGARVEAKGRLTYTKPYTQAKIDPNKHLNLKEFRSGATKRSKKSFGEPFFANLP